ncbi:MAG: hypothetical protein AB7R89_08230 [Dehalococcoidia bacterium]
MNLSPAWESTLTSHGWPAVHWSNVGDGRATDRTIMDWAKASRPGSCSERAARSPWPDSGHGVAAE